MNNTTPRLITTIAELRESLAAVRRDGKRIGLVPTMGALHEGHLSLVRAAKAECDCTVVSIYVNPTQFGPKEDFSKYPRTLQSDLELLAGCGADVVFAPTNEEMYAAEGKKGTVPDQPSVGARRNGPEGASHKWGVSPFSLSTWVEVGTVAGPLEGQCRPGHFRGVATVVLKLFNIVQPDAAYFGQKDYQQTAVIRRMTADLNLPLAIRVCPIVREPDGLALSSRNRYLSPAARQRALVLWKSLQAAAKLVEEGHRDAGTIVARMREVIETAEDARIDYVALVDPDTLQPVERIAGRTLAVLAVKIENTRLIDNCLLG
jgi:pantoate--beta-alanine ligase